MSYELSRISSYKVRSDRLTIHFFVASTKRLLLSASWTQNGRGFNEKWAWPKIFARATRATLFNAPPTFSIFLRLCTMLLQITHNLILLPDSKCPHASAQIPAGECAIQLQLTSSKLMSVQSIGRCMYCHTLNLDIVVSVRSNISHNAKLYVPVLNVAILNGQVWPNIDIGQMVGTSVVKYFHFLRGLNSLLLSLSSDTLPLFQKHGPTECLK